MEKNRFCIVHYKEPYIKLNDVNELDESRTREAKEKREKMSGENFHEKQCISVPDASNNKIHGVHIDPCYKRFTLILSKKEDQPITTTMSSKRTSLDETAKPETAWMFPEPCHFCKKKSVQYKGIKVTTYDADKSIKAGAKVRIMKRRWN